MMIMVMVDKRVNGLKSLVCVKREEIRIKIKRSEHVYIYFFCTEYILRYGPPARLRLCLRARLPSKVDVMGPEWET